MDRFFNANTASFAQFEQLCQQTTNANTYPHASDINKNIVVYDARQLNLLLETNNLAALTSLKSELNH